MGRKKKHEEHVNLERYLVSYADFITLLFATFVVLYALSQVDISAFSKLEEALKSAFEAPSIMQGNPGIMNDAGDNLLENRSADSVISALMMEYLSPKYEAEAYESIKKDIEEMSKSKELEGVSAIIDERGLVIKLNDSNILFRSASAKLQDSAKAKLDKVGLLIAQKFLMHSIRVEGNTDSLPFSNAVYPSNWELSSARACSIVRYLIDRFKFHPDLFTPIGYSSTRPISDNKTEKGRAQNRRVEIVILRNKFKKHEQAQNTILKMTKEEQEAYRNEHIQAINRVKGISDAALKLTGDDEEAAKNVLILNEIYSTESQRINTVKLIQQTKNVDNVENVVIKEETVNKNSNSKK